MLSRSYAALRHVFRVAAVACATLSLPGCGEELMWRQSNKAALFAALVAVCVVAVVAGGRPRR
jgi:nucleoside recognition membrane protein YjiH